MKNLIYIFIKYNDGIRELYNMSSYWSVANAYDYKILLQRVLGWSILYNIYGYIYLYFIPRYNKILILLNFYSYIKIKMGLILLFNNLAWLNIVIACQHNFWEKDAPDIAFYVFFAGIICGLFAIGCLCNYLDEQDNIQKELNKINKIKK